MSALPVPTLSNGLCNRRHVLRAGAALATLGWPARGRAQPVTGPAHATATVTATVTTTDDTWTDPARQRALPVRVRWPAADAPPAPQGGRPVLLFSHGLGGTRAGGEVWGQAWAAAGMVVVHLQHPGSDLAAVRNQVAYYGGAAGLARAIGPVQLLARLQDVAFVLDEVARRHTAREGAWASVRPEGLGLAGHSFGAHTTLGMAGQNYPGQPGLDEPRLAAFIAFSPTLPAVGDPLQAFARLTRPLLSITGTRDGDVVNVGATPDRRIGVFDALPAGRKAQLVLQDADHMTFAGQTGRAVELLPRVEITRQLQARHHALVAEVSTDWWRAHLLNDDAARSRLAQPKALGAGDVWQRG